MPMNDRRRPSVLKVDNRGVAMAGKGNNEFDVRVIVEGVRASSVGEGGNTNNVCEGFADSGTRGCDFFIEGRREPRKDVGGSSSLRPSVRVRVQTGGIFTGVTGEDGTGGRRPTSGGGRLLVLCFI